MEKQYITLINDDGSETLAEILFTYYSEEFNKNYVVFLPEDGEGVAAASYVEEGNKGSLQQITTDAEWELIENLLEEYVAQLEATEGCACGGEGCEECDCDGECDGEEECSCGCHKNAN